MKSIFGIMSSTILKIEYQRETGKFQEEGGREEMWIGRRKRGEGTQDGEMRKDLMILQQFSEINFKGRMMIGSVSESHAYLDITEYTFQEYQPNFSAQEIGVMQFAAKYLVLVKEEGPNEMEIEPVDHDPRGLAITPLLDGIVGLPLDPLALDEGEVHVPRLLKQPTEGVEEALRILDSPSLDQEEEGFDHSQPIPHPKPPCVELPNDESQSKSQDVESTINTNLAQFAKNIELLTSNPCLQILSRMSEIMATDGAEEEKRSQMKKYLSQLLLEHEYPSFEEAWRDLPGCLQSAVEVVQAGIEDTFAKVVNGEAYETRRLRLVRYFEKKYRRMWKQKASRSGKKKMADGRLRIKGKFVSKQQAFVQMRISSAPHYAPQNGPIVFDCPLEA